MVERGISWSRLKHLKKIKQSHTVLFAIVTIYFQNTAITVLLRSNGILA
jgi:hypothetical protein